jgi:TOMM system kinase/cyclase fusion protein
MTLKQIPSGAPVAAVATLACGESLQPAPGSPTSASAPTMEVVTGSADLGPDLGDGVATRRLGDTVGGDDNKRFELRERLGSGGMGTVFLAFDTLLDRTVALKFLTGAGAEDDVVERLRLEARATARLNHENIVRIFDLGSADGVPFLAMEYVDGQPLATVAARGEIDALRAVRIMADVARGLAHAHRMGIVHRDLKPSNVILARDGRAKILDFGIATVGAWLGGRAATDLSGTPWYMGPEQWRNDPQDGRSDIWAAGVMLFELLTGKPPFPGEYPMQVFARVLSPEPAPSIRSIRPDLPEEAERVVERALRKDLAQRLGTAEEMLDLLVGVQIALERNVRAAAHEAAPRVTSRPASERRQVTLLSCSLDGLLGLAGELELDEFADLLGSFFAICTTVVRQLDGAVIAALGGRIVACFGYPVAHEDGAQRAVRAAMLINGALGGFTRKDGTAHGARVGVHTCFAVVGKEGSGRDERPLVRGTGPHLATWLEQQAARGEIFISRRTQALLRGMFEVALVGTRTPDGGRPMEVLGVLRPVDAESRFEHVGALELTPIVGREAEAGDLRDAWAEAVAGHGQFVLLDGEAGMGKSRLVQLLRAQLADEPHTRISCQCWPHFSSSALHAIVDGLMRGVGIRPENPAAERLSKLAESIAALQLDTAEYVPLLATYLSIPLSAPYVAPALSPDLLKSRVMEALLALLLKVAAQQPTLLVVEDLHWSDAASLELLELLLARVGGARLMVLLTFRPELRVQWSERAHLRRISLARLTSSQTAAMVTLTSRGRSLPAEVVERLVERAEGNPLFIEELTVVVADHWYGARDAAASARTFAAGAIPASLQELLHARLDGLAGAGKEVAQVGAVLGREFSLEILERVCPLDEAVFRRGLMQLVEAGVVRQEGLGANKRYVFKHALIQEAAYQSLVRDARRELHRRAAAAMIACSPDEVELHPELLAHHHAEGGELEQAIPALEKAAQRAVQRWANVDAATHLQRALALLATLPESNARDRRELALRLALGAPLMSTRGYAAPEVHATYARARDLCPAVGDDAQLFPAVLGLWQFYMVGGEAETSAVLGRQLLTQAQSSADPIKLMLAHRGLGTSLLLLGDYAGCRAHTTLGLALYDRERHGALAVRFGQDPGVTNGLYLAWALWFLGDVDEAVVRARDAVENAKRIEHPLSIAFAQSYLAVIHNSRGEHEVAKALAVEARAVATEHRLALWLAMSKIQHGLARLGLGDRSGADELLEGIGDWTRTGAKSGLTYFLCARIWGLWQADRLDEAMEAVVETEAFIERSKERFYEAELLRLRGEVLLARSPTFAPEAEACFRRGLALAQQQGALTWERRLTESLASRLAPTPAEEAPAPLESAHEPSTEGPITTDLRETRAVLREIS